MMPALALLAAALSAPIAQGIVGSFVIFTLGAILGILALLATDAWVKRCRRH